MLDILAAENNKLKFISIISEIDRRTEMIVTEKFEINGRNVSYARYGSVWKETAVLFFHGFTGSKKYIPDLEELTDTCIISFDRPGVGESDVQDYYTMEDFFTCINEVLDYHGVKKLRLIGT